MRIIGTVGVALSVGLMARVGASAPPARDLRDDARQMRPRHQAGASAQPLTRVAGGSSAPSTASPSTASTGLVPRAATTTSTIAVAGQTSAFGASGTATCHVRGTGLYALPDPNCTPGVTNPAVTQADIYLTICYYGWAESVRPPEAYTENLKFQQLAEYGETGPVHDYEEDHLIPLELGGSPTDPRNLWPEPGAAPNPKDRVEDAANHAVCDGQMPLAEAQAEIATNWVTLGIQLGVLPSSAAAGQ